MQFIFFCGYLILNACLSVTSATRELEQTGCYFCYVGTSQEDVSNKIRYRYTIDSALLFYLQNISFCWSNTFFLLYMSATP